MKVVIVGAGMMGLTLGHRLSEAGVEVTLLEAQPQVGGLSTWFDYGEFVWDKYYHVILKSDCHLLDLIQELGLADRLFWMPTKTGFLWHGQLISMSNHWEFLQFPALNAIQKLRLGLGIMYSHYIQRPEQLDNVSAVRWLTRVFGRRVYATLWEPLLASKFGVLKDEVPARILWSTINRYFSTRSKGDGKEWMGHLRGTGLKVLFDTLVERIQRKGGKIHCGVNIKSMDEHQLVASDGRTFAYDRVISTIPTPVLHRIAPFTKAFFIPTKGPKFLGVIRLALVLKRSLTPYYVTNLIDKGLPFTGIIEVSALTEPEELHGKKLVMVPRYDVPESPWFEKPDAEIYNAFVSPMKATWPDLEDNIERSFVHREKIVQALWINQPADTETAAISPNGKVWSINAELAGRDTLNNNAIIRVANMMSKKFLVDSLTFGKLPP